MEHITFKKYLDNFYYGLVLFILLTGCGDILEQDISEEKITVFAPLNGMETDQNVILFWWDEVEAANEYQVQVIKGTYENIEQYVLDTTVESTRFKIPLSAGNYEWKIKGVNNKNETVETKFQFSILGSSNLSNKQIVFKNTADTLFTKASSYQLNWYSIDSITHYKVNLYNSITNATTILSDITESPFYVFNFSEEGEYLIGIKGVNNNSTTNEKTAPIIFDSTDPEKASLSFPTNGEIIGDSTFTFLWTNGPTGLSSEQDSIFISDNSGFNTYLISAETQRNQYSDSLGKGTFYWRIKTFDKAGNSILSETENFTVN